MKRLQENGVSVKVAEFEALHGFFADGSFAEESVQVVADWIRERANASILWWYYILLLINIIIILYHILEL